MSVYSIVDTTTNHKSLNPKRLNQIRGTISNPIDTPPTGIPTFSTQEDFSRLEKGNSYLCLIPVKLLYSDDSYNRIDDLNVTKAIQSLEKANGFSYNHANSLVGFLRPDGVIVLTQGNHRACMKFLTAGQDGLVLVSLRVHSETDIIKCQQIEAEDFNTDGTCRYNMTQYHRFKGGYGAGKKEYIDLYNLVKQYGISIAGTNKGDYIATKSFESYTYLQKALKLDKSDDKRYVHACLSIIPKYLQEHDIKGYVFIGMVLFLQGFNRRLELIKKVNKLIYSHDDFVKYIFTERRKNNGKGKLTTQDDITGSSGDIKNEIYFGTRFVALFNEYALDRELTIKCKDLQGDLAIPERSKDWREFTENLSSTIKKIISVDSL